MNFKYNPYRRLLMNIILLHCLISFLHASFAEDSALVYVCMLYVGAIVLGQYAIRQHIRNFAAYLLLHLLLTAPCAAFMLFSITDVVLMGLFAVILTILSFKKSIDNKNKASDTFDGSSPFEILLLPLFAIIGSYYEYPIYTSFVFFEAIIYLVLFVSYTFSVNEQHYVRDHCSTANIPFKRIRTTTGNIKFVFIAVIIVVMLLVKGADIVIPKFSLNYDPATTDRPIYNDTQIDSENDYIDFQELGVKANPPSALAVFLSYVFAGLIVLAGAVLLFVLIFSVFRTLRNSIHTEKYKSTYFEEDEITVETLSIERIKKPRSFERAITNSDKIRRLFKNTTTKRLAPLKGQLLGFLLNSKTPSEINNILKDDNAYSSGVITLYQEARYSNHEIGNESVKEIKRQLLTYR